MRKINFEVDKDGLYGVYYKNRNTSNASIIAMIGDDASDYMARKCAKWLMSLGVNVLSMSPGKKDYSHHNYPLERIKSAIEWLKEHGSNKIGIVGASTTGTLALTASSFFNDISLTIALTPSDFIWQGFKQGNKDGCKEWPVEGESLFTYQGKQLDYMPFCYKHPEYWQIIRSESKKNGDMINSLKIFNDSEANHPIKENEFIKIENIKGKLILIGAEDDALWDTTRYIKRMQKRLEENSHDCDIEAYIYKHGTHYVFPESLLKSILPIDSKLFLSLAFKAAKEFPNECKATRIDIDHKVRKVFKEWLDN